MKFETLFDLGTIRSTEDKNIRKFTTKKSAKQTTEQFVIKVSLRIAILFNYDIAGLHALFQRKNSEI